MARAKSNKTNNSGNLNNSQTMNSQTFQPETAFTPTLTEQEFIRSFQPLTSRKDGKAQLTFAGYKHSVRNDGNGAFLKIVFSVLDITQKNPANISVNSNYKYSEENTLGRLLKMMGYQHKVETVVLDEDDEFGYTINEDLNQIYTFLESQKGLMFKGICESKQNKRGEWWYQIEVDTVEPLLDKNGNQKRAYDASEGMSEEELNIDIEARGGDEN